MNLFTFMFFSYVFVHLSQYSVRGGDKFKQQELNLLAVISGMLSKGNKGG